MDWQEAPEGIQDDANFLIENSARFWKARARCRQWLLDSGQTVLHTEIGELCIVLQEQPEVAQVWRLEVRS